MNRPTSSDPSANTDVEAARLATLAAYDILDTPAEAGFDDIVHLASQACDTSVALVSFVSFDRQWFKASVGFGASETTLDRSVCAHVVKEGRLLVFPDLTQDARTRDNPLVTGEPHIRFYAGAPLTAPSGEVLGALCVIDNKTRAAGLTERQSSMLLALARQVMSQMELRRLLRVNGAQADALAALNASLERQVADRTRERSRTWEISPDMLGILTPDGLFEASNPAWKTTLGWSEETIRTTKFFDFVHPDDLARTHDAWGVVNEGRPILRFENRYRHEAGGWRRLSWMVSPEGDKFYCTARDVTVETEQADALRAAEDSLRQSQKMEAVGQLTGGLAHDFNNLLMGISGSLELLRSRIVQGRFDDVGRYASAAQGAVERAAALTHRLLAFSRRQTLTPKPVDMNRLIADMEELLRRTIGPPIALEVVGAIGLWSTLADGNQLENALLNLCINARDAMPDGGRLTIETANKWLDDRAAKERDLPSGQYVSLCVTDTGTGMTPDVAARAFDPFFTTKPMGSGTGLGLSMIYGFARQSGGQVRVYSEIDVGTTMCIYLPRHLGEPNAEAGSNAPNQTARAEHGETILVVDDEPLVRMLITEVVEDAGYIALEAADGPSGLRILQSAVRIDLVITDVGLPGGMNGRQMADAARVSRQDLKVLFVTRLRGKRRGRKRSPRRRNVDPDQALRHGCAERENPRHDGDTVGCADNRPVTASCPFRSDETGGVTIVDPTGPETPPRTRLRRRHGRTGRRGGRRPRPVRNQGVSPRASFVQTLRDGVKGEGATALYRLIARFSQAPWGVRRARRRSASGTSSMSRRSRGRWWPSRSGHSMTTAPSSSASSSPIS